MKPLLKANCSWHAALLSGVVLVSLAGCADTQLPGTPIGFNANHQMVYQYCTNGGKCIRSLYPTMDAYAFYYQTSH
jgi:hypothetical protein